MRLLVCGSRRPPPEVLAAVFPALDEWHRRRAITCIIEGEAQGIDRRARKWAEARGVPFEAYPVTPAEWDAWKEAGKPQPSPGTLRNGQMLREGKPTAVLAFPGNVGTANMMKQTRDAGVPLARVVMIATSPGWEIRRIR